MYSSYMGRCADLLAMLQAAPSDTLLPHLVNLQRVQDRISQLMDYNQLDVQNQRDEVQTKTIYQAFNAELEDLSTRLSLVGISQGAPFGPLHLTS
jgi:hypothetical protein